MFSFNLYDSFIFVLKEKVKWDPSETVQELMGKIVRGDVIDVADMSDTVCKLFKKIFCITT